MIELEPERAGQLLSRSSKIYEDAGRYEEAEQALHQGPRGQAQRSRRLHDASRASTTARASSRRRWRRSTRRPSSSRTTPQGYQLRGDLLLGEGPQGPAADAAQKKEYIGQGHRGDDKALGLNPDYIDALTYKNILLRLQGNVETDLAKQQPLYRRGRPAPEPARSSCSKKKATGRDARSPQRNRSPRIAEGPSAATRTAFFSFAPAHRAAPHALGDHADSSDAGTLRRVDERHDLPVAQRPVGRDVERLVAALAEQVARASSAAPEPPRAGC